MDLSESFIYPKDKNTVCTVYDTYKIPFLL